MKVICSISARIGSKEIPKKNIRLLNGKPLITYAIKAALNSKLINKVIVNTDSKDIAVIGKEHGAEVPFIRNPNLADDKTPLLMVTKNTMEQMVQIGYEPDIIIQLSPTCPFIKTETIDESIILAKEYMCALTVKKIEHEHPYRAKILDNKKNIKPFIKDVDVEKFQSRQDLPLLYCTSGAIYTRTKELLSTASEHNFCLGPNPRGIILNDVESINIDREIDFKFSEFLMNENIQY